MSNTTAVDPRRKPLPANDPRKRPPSHSPEPGRPQKQPRSGQPPEAMSPKDGESSRRSSLSNATASHVGAPPGIMRQPSTQLKADLRKEAEDGMQSPNSPIVGSASDRSTPQYTNGAGAMNTDAEGKNPILAALQKFSSQVATQASLETAQRHAEQSHQRASAEYKKLKGNYQGFPALQEKKNKARVQASTTLQQAKQNLKNHSSDQNRAMENLATLIGSAGNAKSEAETCTDATSRDELDHIKRNDETMIKQYNTLSTSFNEMQGRLRVCEQQLSDVKRIANIASDAAADGMQYSKEALKTAEESKKASAEAAKGACDTRADLAAMARDSKAVKASADEAQKLYNETKRTVESAVRRADHAEDTANEALKRAQDAKSASSQMPQLQGRVDNVTNEIKRLNDRKPEGLSGGSGNNQQAAEQIKTNVQAFRKELDDFKTQTSAQYALRKDVGDLESRIDKAAQDVAGARKANAALLKDIEQIKTKASSIASAGSDSEYKSRADQLWQPQIFKDGPKLTETMAKVEKELIELQNLTIGDGKTAANHKIQDFDNLLGWLESHEGELGQHRDKILAITNDIEDSGKGTVQDRFKKIDRAINNLSTQVDGDGKTTIPQRITQVEKQLGELQQSVEANRSLPAPANAFSSQTSLEEGEIRSQQPTETFKDVQHGKLILRVPALEEKYDALRQEFDDVKSQVRVDSPSGHVTVDVKVEERLENVEDALQSLNDLQDQKDGMLLDEIETKAAELRSTQEEMSRKAQEELSKLNDSLTEVKTKFDGLEMSLQSKASQESLEQGITAAIHPMLESINKLQGQVTQLQQPPKARQTSMSAPQTPPIFGQPSHMPMPNGVGTPHMNGHPQRALTPQAQPPPDLKLLIDKIDANVVATAHVKQRCDNLVTDDVVRAMATQLSEMFPEAKNFNGAHKALAKRTDALEGEVRGLKTNNAGAMNKPGEIHAVRTRIDTLERGLRETNEQAKRAERVVVNLKDATAAPFQAAPTPAPTNSVTQADFTTLRDRVDEIGKTAKAADILSRGHGSRFSTLGLTAKKMSDLDAMQDTVKKHTCKIDSLEWKTSKLEKDVVDLADEMVKGTVEEAMGKIMKP